jgi:8-oxo-dGTP pyrophosphatase MutT (NUDIX family)
MKRRWPWGAAAREALEEVGIRGRRPLGTYRDLKARRDGLIWPRIVTVYPFLVTVQRDQWRDANARGWRWFSRDDAARSRERTEYFNPRASSRA